jgi:hypothetical protein
MDISSVPFSQISQSAVPFRRKFDSLTRSPTIAVFAKYLSRVIDEKRCAQQRYVVCRLSPGKHKRRTATSR